MYHKAIEMLEDVCPGVARVMAEVEPGALAYLDFAAFHWKRLRTNNLQERANIELKRRPRVAQVSPRSPRSIGWQGPSSRNRTRLGMSRATSLKQRSTSFTQRQPSW